MNLTDIKRKNRYGDEYTYSVADEHTVYWRGPFNHCRYSRPLDYSEAYTKYRNNGGELSMNRFKVVVWEDDGLRVYQKGVKIVDSMFEMVDPSGGPYIGVGDSMESLTDGLVKGRVTKILPVDNNTYKIITE